VWVNLGAEDNVPRNAFKPRVQPRKPSLTLAHNSSATEDVLAAEHANFNRMFDKRDEADEGTSPTYLPVWKPQVISFAFSTLLDLTLNVPDLVSQSVR